MSRAAFLLDKFLYRLGLNGKALVPGLVAFGCNVPAIMGTRVLDTRREKIIASYLITLIPCSSRIAVIFGAVGYYAGILWAIAIFLIDIAVITTAGLILNKVLAGSPGGLVMEVPPYRIPDLSDVWKKTWARTYEFIRIGLTIVVIGSVILAILNNIGTLETISGAIAPFTEGALGLPPEAGIALIYGIVRKELALEALILLQDVELSGMTTKQLFIFGTITTLYFPCIAVFKLLTHELGRKNALLIATTILLTALTIGATINLLL